MNAYLVGADRLGNIPETLVEYGIRITGHVSGREPSHQKHPGRLPAGVDVLILFTDFLGHNVMKGFRSAAGRAGIRVVACRRSVCSMRGALETQGFRCDGCGCVSRCNMKAVAGATAH